jgi:hypothetical protein
MSASDLFNFAKDSGVGTTLEYAIQRVNANLSFIDAKNKNGRTPLMMAAKKHSHNVVYALLKAGANPTITDPAGQTAISYLNNDGSPTDTYIIGILSNPLMPYVPSAAATASAATGGARKSRSKSKKRKTRR